jgi:GT2 family glycosyltransferase
VDRINEIRFFEGFILMTKPFVINVILNFNRRDDTLACLASLENSTFTNHKNIVLDVSSSDGSKEAIHSTFPEVQIIDITENRGYAGNNNVGIAAALAQGADWIFVLNEDTLLAADCLSHLVEIGESDSEIGIVGPMVYHYDEPNIIQSAGGLLGPYWSSIHLAKNELDKGQFSEPHDVDWISGCGIMLRRGVIEQVGMLDERFFYYWEETEWCLRTKKAGWRVVHVPKARLWHKGVQRDYRPNPNVTYFNTRNHLLLLKKHHAPIKVWVFTWLQIGRTLVSWTIKPKWRPMREHRNAMWRGLLDFFRQRLGGPVQL